jgi:type IV secretory pathway TraG/TraD family ATPase VirD4
LNPKAVYGAVVENTQFKIAYRTNNPETAKYFSDFSGQITAYSASHSMDPQQGQSPGSWAEIQRNLIEANELLNLPRGVAVLYGVGTPRKVGISPIAAAERPMLTYRLEPEGHTPQPEAPASAVAGRPAPTDDLEDFI